MKHLICCVAISVAVSTSAVWGQQRPTLGPSEPSLNGPKTSTTTDRLRLLRVRAIYIERMDNGLSGKLMDGFAKMGWARLVEKPEEADAVMRGTCFDSRRLKRLHSEVFLSDRVSGSSIWQDIVRVPLYPPPLARAVDQTANGILRDLSHSVQAAANK